MGPFARGPNLVVAGSVTGAASGSVTGPFPDIVLSSFDSDSSPSPLEPESDVAKDGYMSTEMIVIDVIDDKSDKTIKKANGCPFTHNRRNKHIVLLCYLMRFIFKYCFFEHDPSFDY